MFLVRLTDRRSWLGSRGPTQYRAMAHRFATEQMANEFALRSWKQGEFVVVKEKV